MDAERWLAEQGWLGGEVRHEVPQEVVKTTPPRPEEECDLTQVDCLKHIVHQYPVVIFSKYNCPFCAMALEAMGHEGAHPHVIELTYLGPKAHSVQQALGSFTGGRTTVPNVFVGGQETAGLQRLGELKKRLLAAGAIG